MSTARFEAFLARLYSDQAFLQSFMRDPETVAREAGLDEREQRAVAGIDRAGLLMAARSYESKRDGRRRRGLMRWLIQLGI